MSASFLGYILNLSSGSLAHVISGQGSIDSAASERGRYIAEDVSSEIETMTLGAAIAGIIIPFGIVMVLIIVSVLLFMGMISPVVRDFFERQKAEDVETGSIAVKLQKTIVIVGLLYFLCIIWSLIWDVNGFYSSYSQVSAASSFLILGALVFGFCAAFFRNATVLLIFCIVFLVLVVLFIVSEILTIVFLADLKTLEDITGFSLSRITAYVALVFILHLILIVADVFVIIFAFKEYQSAQTYVPGSTESPDPPATAKF